MTNGPSVIFFANAYRCLTTLLVVALVISDCDSDLLTARGSLYICHNLASYIFDKLIINHDL